jgi:hypothetical protein
VVSESRILHRKWPYALTHEGGAFGWSLSLYRTFSPVRRHISLRGGFREVLSCLFFLFVVG